jgi:sugar (pentulose or hexulose) kinase
MSARDVVVGVDVGTGSARALAVARDGRVVARSSAPFAGRASWPPGQADPQGWRAALDDALSSLGVVPAALAIGSQSPTTVPLDGRFALTVRHPAGITLSPHEQHLAQRDVLGGDVCQLWDWLLRSLGADAVQTRWPGDPSLDGYGALRRTGEVVGSASGVWGVPARTPLVGGAQDAYLAFWAGGTDEPGRAVDPGGRTGGLAVAVDAGSRPDGMYALVSAAPGVDVVGGPVAAHGLMLEWLSSLTGVDESSLLSLAADVPPGAGGVVVLPCLEGERAPRWNRDLRAEIVGLGSEHTRAHVTRAVLEGAAYGLRQIADELRAAGVAIDVVVCGGSPAHSRLWCEVKASVLGVPVEVPSEPDLAAYGAALAAGAGIGWWPPPGSPSARTGAWPRPSMTIVDPVPDPAYERGYAQFVSLGDAAVARLSKEPPCPTPTA